MSPTGTQFQSVCIFISCVYMYRERKVQREIEREIERETERSVQRNRGEKSTGERETD